MNITSVHVQLIAISSLPLPPLSGLLTNRSINASLEGPSVGGLYSCSVGEREKRAGLSLNARTGMHTTAVHRSFCMYQRLGRELYSTCTIVVSVVYRSVNSLVGDNDARNCLCYQSWRSVEVSIKSNSMIVNAAEIFRCQRDL